MKQKYFFKTFLILSLSFCSFQSFAQAINDDFEDGDLTGWTQGTAGHWANSSTSPITGTNSLKHNLSGISDESYIYHSISSLDLTTQNITWQFNIKNGNWDPSSSNRFWIYLTANETNLLGNTVDGYAVGVNLTGTTDILTLWKVTNGAADGAVITSALDWNSNTTVGVKVTRTTAGLWELSIDNNGGFDNLVSAGTATNTDYTHDGSFGLSFDFTSSRAGLLWIDDVLVEGSAPSTDPTIGFDSASSGVTETDSDVVTAGIPITLINYTADVTITPTVNGSSTAEAGDYTIDLTPIVFNANETNNIPLTIKDDADMDNETIVIDFTVTSGTATLGTSQHTVTITDDDLPNLIINEVLADPNSTTGDANGDGTVSTSQDEFIELYNNEGSDLDISGYYIQDAASGGTTRHVFPNGTVLPNNQTIVVFGGGSIVGVPGLAQLASTGSLGINNGAETLTLYNASDTQITQVTLTGASDQSQAREPDLTGAFTAHSSIAGNTVDFSPGKDNTDNSHFTPLVTWDGSDSSAWNLGANWDTGTAPTSINDILIPSGMPNEPTISSSTGAVGINLTVNTGAVLTIESGGTLILNRYGRSTGNLTYNINVADDKWHLLSSPVVGEQYDDTWVGAPNLIDTNGSNRAISTYINTSDADGDWVYSQTSTTGTFNSGIGYSMKRTAAGNLAFTGTFPTEDVKTTISQGFGGVNKWNLSGNPFPSYIRASELIAANAVNLTDTHEFIYVWDNSENGGAGGYKAIAGTDYIHTGQGFFVNADNSTADNFVISKSLQSNQNGITFYRNSNASIKLFMSNGNSIKNTEIKYEANSTKSLDPGFDAGTFTGTSTGFNIYTHLVNNSEGVDFMLQSLPDNDYENMIIPIGVNATNGNELTFTTDVLNLPTNIKVFLEDRESNTFTRLDEPNTDYKVTLSQDLNGIGRFYLHTTASALNIKSESLENVSVYKSDLSTLRIVGLQQGKTDVKLFNTLGKQVMNTSFTSNGVKDISLPKLSSGIYIVQLQTDKGKLNKKIVLE